MITLDGTTGITTPEIVSTGGPLVVNASAPDNSVVVDASGNVGIGTSSPSVGLSIQGTTADAATIQLKQNASGGQDYRITSRDDGSLRFNNDTAGAERMRIDSSGNLLIGTTDSSPASNNVNGAAIRPNGFSASFTGQGGPSADFNRRTNDGPVINIRQDGTIEGQIVVSGTTVSYNGGHLARWAQTITAKDESLVKGTVLSNLNEMNVYVDADDNPVDNEQLNKVKVSDVEGDANVAGVFVNWEHDEAHNVDEINMAMTGDMIIRIAAGTTVARGDLLMSAGDGTAKPQGDDIVRSKTIAKVTSTHVTCTYADGSFCVPCVLMAC